MLSINTCRNTVMYILNKSNRGYIGTSEFDYFCQLAQMDIFENLFYQYNQFVNKQNKRLTGAEYADIPKNIREAIDIFTEYSTTGNFTYDSTPKLWSFTGNDLYRVLSLSLVNTTSKKKILIEEVSKIQLNYINNNPMTTPSLLFPVCTRIGSKFSVVPDVPSGHIAELLYIRKPKDPKWTYVVVGGNPIYNGGAGDLQDIELHISLFPKFITKVLALCGVSIREESVVQEANSEEMKQWQKQQQS